MNELMKAAISNLFTNLVEGYKSKDWLASHSCPVCDAGAQAFAEGKLDRTNPFSGICDEATEHLKKVARSDFIIAHFEKYNETILQQKQDRYSNDFSEQQGLRFI